jgi:two-component system, NtrC family, sensor kinase
MPDAVFFPSLKASASGSLLPWGLFLFASAVAVAMIFRQRKRIRSLTAEHAQRAQRLDAMLRESRATTETISLAVHFLLNNRSKDAYREALSVIAKACGVQIAVFILIRVNGDAMAFDQEGKEANLSSEELRKLEDILEDPVWRAGERRLVLPLPGYASQFIACAPLRTRGTGFGHLILARPSTTSELGEATRIRLSAIAEVLAPVLASRSGRTQEETKRKSAERELHANEGILSAFMENSPDMVYKCDAEDRFLSINRAGIALLGLSEEKGALGRLYGDFVLNDSDRQAILRRLRSDGIVHDFEIVIVRKNGSAAFCADSSQAIYSADGAYQGVQGIVKDISERIENDRRLWKLTMDLTAANVEIEKARDLVIMQEKLASIGQLAAGVAHEINNPLGFLKSNREMTKEYVGQLMEAWAELSAEQRERAAQITKRLDLDFAIENLKRMDEESADGIDRIVRIVSNLKSFARKNVDGEKAPYDMNGGVNSTLVMAANELKYVANVELNLGEVPTINANGNEINQVILNILVNASQAIAEQKRSEKGRIRIATCRRGSGVECVISDDGPGMAPEVMGNIFEPFFTTKESGKGTGLGLSISNDIITGKHGGSLSVESAPGKGATFTIYLPGPATAADK